MGRLLTGALALALILVAGCGGSEEEREDAPPSGPLGRALATIGGGGANGSLGVGWAEPQLVEEIGGGPELIAAALGPNAGSVVEARATLQRRFGFDPLNAERLVSVGGSYAFGLRVDGGDGGTLPQALSAAGLRERRRDGILYLESGEYAQVPPPLLEAGVRGLGAFDAFDRAVVLAISDGARATLLGEGARLSEQPTYRAAAECLGNVVAARMVPDKLLLSTEQGVDLVAVGVGAAGDALCVLGGAGERADEIAENLERSLPAAEVARSSHQGVEIVRAGIAREDTPSRGYVFDLLAGATVIDLINGESAAEIDDGP